MRITKVSVKKLFGIFDHEIPLNQESRITIIHGPNGVGKTILFRMINDLFNRRYKIFSEIPFEEFSVCICIREPSENGAGKVSNGSISLTKTLRKQDPRSNQDSMDPRITLRFFDGKEAFFSSFLLEKELTDSPRELSRLYRLISSTTNLERIDDDLWVDLETGSEFTLEQILEKYEHISDKYLWQEPAWYTRIIQQVNTRFIQTQRLQKASFKTERSPYLNLHRLGRGTSEETELMVEKYSKNIVEDIQRVSTRYAAESEKIDREFPEKLLNLSDNSPKYDQASLSEKLAMLENTRADLMKLGLFEDHEAPPLINVNGGLAGDFSAGLAGVFSIYVDDVEKKLAVFEQITDQLRILTDLVNAHFQHKTLTINKQEGFVLKASDGKRIPLIRLSSGEQHMLVMFYRLLFDVKPQSLILIDEPETSLHVLWQEKFLGNIERISQSSRFDVLIATHSPDIIAGHHDRVVSLGTPETAD